MRNKYAKYTAIASALMLAGLSAAHAATATSVTSSANDGNVATNTVDNDLSTRWSANGNDGSQWLQYNFSSAVSLSAVNIAFYKGDSRSTYFQVQSSEDGSTWTVKLDGTGGGSSNELENFEFSETVTAQYIRVVGFGNSSNTWNSITEVTFDDAETPVIDKPVEPIDASALASTDDGNVADNILDGSLDTRWSANGSGQWVRLDLGSEQTLNNVQLAFFKGDARQGIFSIEVSNDDSNWTTIVDETTSSGSSLDLETFAFNETTARYVRYTGYGNSANTWNSLTEFTVTASTGDITCDEGSTLINGVCVEDEIPVICEDGSTLINGVCVEDDVTPICDDGYSLVNNECIEDDKPIDGYVPVTDADFTGAIHYTSADNINDILATAKGGDQIIVTDSGEISIKNMSFDSKILIRAETVGGLKLENATISNSNNIVLQGFLFGPSNDVSTLVKIVNSTNIAVSRNYFDHKDVTEGQSSLVVTESSSNIEIGYNEFHDKNVSIVDGGKNTGSYIKFQYDVNETTGEEQMTKNAHIHHNYFNNITPYIAPGDSTPAGDSDREAIVMGISSSQDIVTNHVVEYNLFENCDGENEILTIKTSDNTFRYNTFKNSMGSLSFRLGHSNKAYGNHFYGTGASDSVTDDNYQTGGIRVYGEGHSVYDNYMEGLSGTTWRRPILIDSGDTSDSSNGDSHQTPTNVTIYNNTIVDSVGGGIHIGGDNYKNQPTAITITDNVVIGSEGTLFDNYSGSSTNTWSGNAAYATGSATANGGTALNASELEVLSSSPSISAPSPLTSSDVGTTAN